MLLADAEWIAALEAFSGYMWSTPVALLLAGAGLLFTVTTFGIQWRIITHGLAVIRGKYDNPEDEGNISHFKALCAALSATIGLGNISGVAIAVTLGGPGALFWMWIVGLLGMATKFTTCSLSTMYRRKDRFGEYRGGPMYYIELGIGGGRGPAIRAFAKVLAVAFAVFTVIASFGMGNTFQAQQVAQVYVNLGKHLAGGLTIEVQWAIRIAVGLILASLAALVMLGGIRRIGQVASRLVPSMCIIYVTGALIVILVNISLVPELFASIFRHAFSDAAGEGAFLGVMVWVAVSQGFRRACFSNEAGLGSAPIAHATAKTNEPIREGVVAGIGPFVDTIVVCTMTGLVILITGALARGPVGTIAEIGAPALDAESGQQVVNVQIDLTDRSVGVIGETLLAKRPTQHAGMFEEIKINIAALDSENPGRVTAELVYADDDDGRAQLAADQALLTPGTDIYLFRAGIGLTTLAFDRCIPGFGTYFIPIAALFFAFSTMISWGFYGETCASYLFGDSAVIPFKLAYVVVIFLGVLLELKALVNLADGLNAMMLVPNLIGTIILLPVVLRAARRYFRRLDAGEFKRAGRPS